MKCSVLASIISLFLLTGCGEEKSLLKFSDGTKATITAIKPGPGASDPAWLSLKKNLFDASCIKCHNPESARIKKRLDLTQKDIVLENYDDILFRMTEAFDMGFDYMPPKGEPVSAGVIRELKLWRSDAQFAVLQKRLFEVSCLKCHGSAQTKHSNLTSKEVLLEKFDEVVYKMTKAFDEGNKPMPPIGKGAKVSEELVQLLLDWKQKRP